MMLIVSYDIVNDKTRTKFAKFLRKYGHRLQYSVYELRNSSRVLNNVLSEVRLLYKNEFHMTDNVLIFSVCEGCNKKIKRFGFAVHSNEDVVIFK